MYMETKDRPSLGDLHPSALRWASFKCRGVDQLLSYGASIGACQFT